MNENHLSWTLRNWITVFLMFMSAYFILGSAITLVKSRTGSAQKSAQTAAGG